MVLLKLLNLGHVLRLLKNWKLRQDANDICLGCLELLNGVYFTDHIDGRYGLDLLANLVNIVNILSWFTSIVACVCPIAMVRSFAANYVDSVIRIYDIARLNDLGLLPFLISLFPQLLHFGVSFFQFLF